jgi:uncharacterized DUF497 family protein
MIFEWDPNKSRANQKKHGVTFEQAAMVFESGDDALEIFDERHSGSEERFITIGPIESGLVLVVWTERREDVIRLISARWASPNEQRTYSRHMEHRR